MVICPDCRQRMQAFFVPARSGSGEVELDRCGQCSSLWFNAGEVQAALGRSIRRRQGSSTRSCPTCRVKLDGRSQTVDYTAGQAFEVPAKSGFSIEVPGGLCEYVCSFLG